MSTRPQRNLQEFHEDPDPAGPVSAADLLLGLQLCRASTMSLTRLQLALRSGDRHCALDAIDRLHALDAKFEHLVQRLPACANENADLETLARHLEDQKIAIAFEKLALASEVSGPDLISRTAWSEGDEGRLPPTTSLALSDEFLAERQIPARRIYWMLLSVLMIVVAATFTALAIAG